MTASLGASPVRPLLRRPGLCLRMTFQFLRQPILTPVSVPCCLSPRLPFRQLPCPQPETGDRCPPSTIHLNTPGKRLEFPKVDSLPVLHREFKASLVSLVLCTPSQNKRSKARCDKRELPVTLAFGGGRQEDQEFKDSHCYTVQSQPGLCIKIYNMRC